MSPAVCGMYAGCSTPGEDWAAPEHDGQICTLLAAPQGDFHPPHHRAPLTPPVTERQWTPSQVSIRSLPTMFAKCRNVPQKCSNRCVKVTSHWMWRVKDAQTECNITHTVKIMQSFSQVGPDVKEEKSTCRNMCYDHYSIKITVFIKKNKKLKSDISEKKQK